MEIYGRWRDAHVAIETVQEKCVGVKQSKKKKKLLGEEASDWKTGFTQQLLRLVETLIKIH